MCKKITLSVLLLLVVACEGSRAKLTPSEALPGHWITEGGEIEYFISKDSIRNMEELVTFYEYYITNSVPPDTITISVKMSVGLINPKTENYSLTLKFSADRNTLYSTYTGPDRDRQSHGPVLWRYAGSDQSPKVPWKKDR